MQTTFVAIGALRVNGLVDNTADNIKSRSAAEELKL